MNIEDGVIRLLDYGISTIERLTSEEVNHILHTVEDKCMTVLQNYDQFHTVVDTDTDDFIQLNWNKHAIYDVYETGSNVKTFRY